MAVDAVVTWVDGFDQEHIKKRQKHLNALEKTPYAESLHPTRFNSLDEITYCLRSLIHFAPWLRTIYVVTDGQMPPIVTAWQGTSLANRIKIIDHRDIFKDFEVYLPTFNSLSIEAMLWRIPGLSERFIYLNDDCMLLRPLQETDFFREGLPVLRGEWKTQSVHKWDYFFKKTLACILPRVFRLKALPPHRVFQEKSARVAGYEKKFLHLPHAPFPLLKQTFADFFKENPGLFLKNLNYPLRDPEQFWIISLVYHLEMKCKQLSLDNLLKVVTVHATHHAWPKIKSKLERACRDPNITFACIQSLDQGTPDIQNALRTWLNKCIPEVI